MQRLGNCAPCAASMQNYIPLGRYSGPRGFGDWYTELKSHLKPMAPWIAGAAIISGYIGFKIGKWYTSDLFLQREARVSSGVPAKRKKRKKR